MPPPPWLARLFSVDDMLWVSGDLLSVLLGRPLSLSHFRHLSSAQFMFFGKVANVFLTATDRGKSQGTHTRNSQIFQYYFSLIISGWHLRCSRHRDLADNKPERCRRTIFKCPERDRRIFHGYGSRVEHWILLPMLLLRVLLMVSLPLPLRHSACVAVVIGVASAAG